MISEENIRFMLFRVAAEVRWLVALGHEILERRDGHRKN